ncbi:hypothetical protein [uncultured Chryseobacterium sp.]|uniref:hypothetical protein n=1 Tax=uncultured Chryseobacterium sp. TaxID=259322 RepID=UPI0025D874A4|nr:hypothetical protein [uncultured Chryseobacterium sp.]
MENHHTNFYEKDIRELKEGLTPFPENIFVADQAWLGNYVLPLISVDLGILWPDLKGTVLHFLNPTEPYEGVIGENTTDFHTEFCTENWLAFRLTEDNQYAFLGKEEYFLSAPKHQDTIDADFTEHIKTIRDNYQRTKARFKMTGQLLPWQEDNPQSFLDTLGGELWEGNWTFMAPVPPAFEMNVDDSGEDLPNDGISMTYQGKEFRYVGEVSGYNYCGEGADAILLFYEPESRMVLFTYDWT